MLWVKAFHIIFMVTWFAGLFYLPRLFVYHATADDRIGAERFKVMERKLFHGIMTPGAVLTIASGLWMMMDYAWAAYAHAGWFQLKLALALVLIAYHVYCGRLVAAFRDDNNRRGHIYYRWFNEFPVLLLIAVVVLVVVRPF